ncbi:class II aldolase/adducin family protein [Agrococcus sediminis]|uniref:class II aldolase/adducin family protein n=1 Tax=Agrococcus TaxID=46352 RepID=UPI001FF6542E|nr:class II aldolase/adducin family protein [Agrococcus sp. SCSIO52902]UOW01852.1 class II aldolase/adducin family protein [Agrococcus sp. SCSIO52902]
MTELTYARQRDRIVDVGRRMWSRGLVAANDGNVSMRLDDDLVLCTPTGVSKGAMSPEQLTVVDLDGTVVEAGSAGGPSSELQMHLGVYHTDADVRAVVHAHPPCATVFAVLGEPLRLRLLPEIVLTMPEIPVAPYATPSTAAVPKSVIPLVAKARACLLEQHGALTWSTDLESAYLDMERLEYAAQLTLALRQIGQYRVLDDQQLDALEAAFGQSIPR